MQRSRRDLLRRRRRDRLLGDGPHPAQARRRHHPARSSTCCCCAATSAAPAPASARCAATPTCRATARWASASGRAPAFLDAPGARVRLRAAARARPRHRRGASRRMRDGEREGLLRDGRQLRRRRRPTPTRTARRAARAAQLTVHVSTKLNRTHLVTGREALHPALPRPHRARRAGRRPAVRDGRGLDEHGARLAGPARPRARRCCRASRRSSPAWRARRSARAARVPWEALVADYDAHPRAHRARGPRLRGLQRARARTPGGFVPAATPRASGASTTADGKARTSRVQPAARASPARPGELLLMTIRSHDQFNTTVYGLDDRYRGIRGDRDVRVRERGRRARGRPARRRPRGRDQPLGRRRRAAEELHGGAVRDPAPLPRRPTSRRPTRWSRWKTSPTAAARRRTSRSGSRWRSAATETATTTGGGRDAHEDARRPFRASGETGRQAYGAKPRCSCARNSDVFGSFSIPTKGSSISTIRKIAPAPESAQMRNTARTVLLRGA